MYQVLKPIPKQNASVVVATLKLKRDADAKAAEVGGRVVKAAK